jgi:hypothetical protein
MGVPDGAAKWAAVEARWSALLEPTAERALLDHLAAQFAADDGTPTGGGR